MNSYKYFLGILFSIILSASTKTFSQVTVTSSDTLNCGTTCTVLTAHVTGDAPTNAGVTEDDVYTGLIPIGFTFNFYGTNYTQCVLGANGTIDFTASDAGAYDPWPISAALLGNTSKLNNICGPWCDIDIFYTASAIGTETYSTDGVAPYRKFSATWCGCSMYSCGAQRITTQIILYETTNVIEVHIARKQICAGWNGGYAIVGVQNAAGTAATTAPGRDFPSVWAVPPTEAWRFTPSATSTSYAVASIPYAPIPLASSAVYWYNATTGAYMGTGLTQTVCPTTRTTYKAGALGCADTSFGYYTVIPSAVGPTVTLTTTNPTLCGTCDGTITLHGLGAGLSDTIHYNLGGSPQPVVVATVTPTGTVTLTGLCPGTYDNFIVKQLTCFSNTAGPVTLVYPGISISSVTPTNPTQCGLCDGSLALYGLYPNHNFTVTYTMGGIAQPPLSVTSDGAGVIKITGLCAGTYSNIVAFFGSCITPAVGPYILTNPPISISSITPTNPSLCGVCDGSLVLNGLYPNHNFTVNYNFNGVHQPPITTTTSATGTITLTGLCAGVYDSIIASFGDCVTPPAGPDTLVNPPISMTSAHTDPSFCGVCDGNIVLSGLYPNHIFTINYNFNGVAQPSVVYTSSATGTITITGLCAGIYSNIIASFGACITPPIGPDTLNNPPTPPTTLVSFVNPSQCGYCDGSIVISSLTPYTSDTVNYSINGTPQPPIITVTRADSTVHLPGLCAGNYTGLTIKIGACIYNVNGSANLVTDSIVAKFDTSVHFGCHGDTVNFSNLSTTTPGAGLFYIWDFGDGTSDTVANPRHIFYTQGTYTVTLTSTNHYCVDSFQEVISLIHPLHAAFIDTPNVVCEGQTVTFTNTTISSPPSVKYLWNFGTGTTDTATNASSIFSNVGTYTVTLVATDWVPCKDTAQGIVYVDTNSGVIMNVTDTVICEGTYMTFTGLYSPIGNTGVTWNFGDGDSTINLNPIAHNYHDTGTFFVTVNALYRACHDISTTRKIVVFPQPHVSLGQDTSICPGSEPLILGSDNANDPSTKWLWNTGETTPTIKVVAPGVYYAIVSIHNCQSTDSITVSNDCYMNLPNVFTPNGDGVNDYFFPRQLLTRGLTSFSMNIYNRWGQLIFETTSLDGRGWDGKFNDVPQPEGAYVYIIDATFKDGQKEHHQGNVTLLR
jgi:gliding motility-associated-like protein